MIRFSKKKWLVIGCVLASVVLLIAFFIPSSTADPEKLQQSQYEMVAEKNERFREVHVTPTQGTNVHQQVLAVVEAVVGNIRSGEFEQATQYFLYSSDTRQLAQGVLDVLANDRLLFSENGVYHAVIQEQSVEIAGNKAQVLVSHTVGGKEVTSRYDLENTFEGWKIAEIGYNLLNDLAETDRLRKQYLAVIKDAQYSENPTSYQLPGGGSVILEKTLFTRLRTEKGTHVDIELHAASPQQNFRVGLYTGSSFAFVVSIRRGEPGTHFHAIDIRPLIESGGGILYFYPDTTHIVTGTVGAPPGGAVLSIPVKLQLK
jgi:hypothetical protein